jgi:putative N6-adenine-specific DNA methylase
MIGERLKHQFTGNDAWILSYREECFEQIGLKPSIKIPVFNGSLECEFRKYQMFDGKISDFRAEGGIVKTEEEKRQMAEKHRFKQNREFKKRLEEQEENESADIRSFKFRSLERKEVKPLRETRDDRDFRSPREFKNHKDPKDFRGSKDSRGAKDFKSSKDFRTAKDFKKDGKPNKYKRFRHGED